MSLRGQACPECSIPVPAAVSIGLIADGHRPSCPPVEHAQTAIGFMELIASSMAEKLPPFGQAMPNLSFVGIVDATFR